jgi:hypothetical protein
VLDSLRTTRKFQHSIQTYYHKNNALIGSIPMGTNNNPTLETPGYLPPSKQSAVFDKESLASLDARVWFLGCGLGCATGLSLLCAFIAIWQKQTVSIAIPALLIALLHASIITVFWVYRFTVHRRHAMMASMLASSILTVVLATLVASGGMASSPLYGLAFMQLGFAFFHPAVLASTTETE